MTRGLRSVLLLSTLICLAPARFLFGADEPNFSEQQKIDFLQHAKVINSRQAKKGVTNPWDVTLSDGTVTHLASFQPIHETKPVMQFADGRTEINFKDFWEYNIAGYRIAKLLGLDDMVPVYTERKWNGMIGSISLMVPEVQFDEGERLKRGVPTPDVDAWNKQMYKVRVMTQLFYDTDPNLTNVLVTKGWKIWRIDFTRAFRTFDKLANPKDLVQIDRQLLAKLRTLTFDQVMDATKPYLNKSEVKALMARRDKIVALFDKMVAEKGENQVLY